MAIELQDIINAGDVSQPSGGTLPESLNAGTFFVLNTVSGPVLYVGSAANLPVQVGTGENLDSGKIFVGNASNKAFGVTMSGDTTITSAGVVTINNNAVTNAKIANSAVTYAKIQNVTANTMLGRVSTTGVVQELGPVAIRSLINVADGANNYVHPNHSGDVTSTSDGATAISTGAVTNSKIRQSAATSVIGRSGTTAGEVADIAAGTNGVLRRNGTGVLEFGTLVTGNIGDNQVTYAKLQDVTADRILGRLTSAGDVQELTATQIRTLINVENGAQVNTVTSVAGKTGAVTLVKGDVGLGNVTNDAQVKKLTGTGTIIGNIPIWSVTTGDALGTGYGVETTLTGDSANLATAEAVKTYVDSLLTSNDAMVFKGTIGTGGTYSVLPTTYNVGWTLRVITAGSYAGQSAEIGDMLIAVVDRAGTGNLDSDWTVLQTNIDGAVTGPASSTNDHVVLFSGTTGKVIKSSGVALGNGTLTLATSGIATGSSSFSANQSGNASFTVNVPGTNLAQGTRTTTSVPITSSTGSTATLDAATTLLAGVMSSADKTKLDGIAANANNYVHPNHTGDVTSTGDGATTIAANAVTAAKFRQSASMSVVGHPSTGGNVQDIQAGTDHQVLRRSGTTLGFGAIALNQSAAVTGTLPVGNGGTGATALTGIVVGNNTSAMTAVAGTAGQLLRRNAANTAYEFFSPTYISGNQTITLSGDVTGSGTTSIATSLSLTGVTAGTYNDSATQVRPFTVDNKGRITGVGALVTITPAWSSITSKPTTVEGYGITNAVYGDNSSGSVNTFLTDGGIGANAITRSMFFRDNGNQFGNLGVHIQHPTNSLYGAQIATNNYTSSAEIIFRVRDNGTWSSTKTLLSSTNYQQYAPSKTGDSASGTWNISVTGNAATATTLQTARTINGVSFNGSSNITIADATKLPLTGGTITGNLIVEDSEIHVGDVSNDSWTRIRHTAANAYGFTWQHGNASVFVNEQGGTNQALVLGDVDAGANTGLFGISHSADSGTTWVKKMDLYGNGELYIGSSGTSHVLHANNYNSYVPSLSGTGASGTWSISVTGNSATATTLQTPRTINGVSFNGSANITITANTTNTLTRGTYLTGSNFNGSAATTWAVDATSANTASKVVARDASGNFSAGTITAALSGNASTASTLQTARTLTIGSTGKTFNGSANVSWSLGEIGAAASSHTHAASDITSGDITARIPWANTNQETNGVYLGIGHGSATVVAAGEARSLWEATYISGNRDAETLWLLSDDNVIIRVGLQTSWASGVSALTIANTGAATFANTVSATTFSGALSGNATTATTLQTARTINGVSFNGSSNITITANTPNSITFNNGGSGAASGSTFNGGSTLTVSYNTVGAPSVTGTNASGTWGISITGNAATVTNGVYTTGSQSIAGAKTFESAITIGTSAQNPSVTGIVFSYEDVTMGSSSTRLIANEYAGGTTTVITLPATSGELALTSQVPSVGNGTLTLAVSGTGLSGSASFTANQSGNATFTVTSNATSANTANAIVARDASGNFTAGTITAALSGNASTATTLQTARTINGVSFNGSANITVTANTPNSLTFNNGGAGAASGTTFNGGSAVTVSYNTVGAPSTTGANASGTWGISISGNAATVTNGVYTTGDQSIGGLKTFNGSGIDLHNNLRFMVSSSDSAHQRADARDDATNFSRLHWFGVSDAGATSNFRHAWYDGASYINITAASGVVTYTGQITATQFNGPLSGNATTASSLQNARTISSIGDVSWSLSFNGGSNVSATATIANNVVTNAKIAQSPGVSVKGNASVTTGNVQDIQATLSGQVLRLSGTTLGFGALDLASANAVTGILPAANIDTAIARLASPTFTGTPSAPTAALNTNTTQIATTAYVLAAIADDAPTKTGSGASGTWNISITGSSASTTGNAGTATTLQTARSINGTSFNGSADITTANWGTSRTITIGSTGKSVNGSANVTWTLSEIGAASTGHKYHSFSSGQYFYDSYEQGNNFRLFTENSTFSTSRFRTIAEVEYWDFVSSAWVTWSGGDTNIKTILSGRETGGFGVTHDKRRFRFKVNVSSGWPTLMLYFVQSNWSPITYPGMTLTLESSTTQGGTYTLRDTAVFTSANTGSNWGIHARTTSSLHTGDSWVRVTFDITDWVDSGGSTTFPIKRFEMLSNYAGSDMVPFSWDYDRNMTFNNNVSASRFTSTVATGTAPLTVTSTTRVANLNVATAGTADTLTTARTINGTSFNGSANITTSSWGTSRTITIGSTGKSVNGSGNVSWSLAEIGAPALSGGSVFTNTGSFRAFSIRTSDTSGNNWSWFAMGGTSDSAGNVWHVATNGTIQDIGDAGAFHIRGNNGATTSIAINQDHSVRFRSSSVFLGATTNSNGTQVVTNSGTWAINTTGQAGSLKSLNGSGGLQVTGQGNTTYTMTSPASNFTVARTDAAQTFTGTQTFSSTISGSISGSAASLTTTRTLWGQNFNGTANVTGALSSVTTIAMSGQLTNTVATGTAPFVISSTTRVANLNVATAGTADQLTTGRTINGTSFNGTANITTANWGTSRTLTIGNTGKAVNGSGNVTWSLAEIGAKTAGDTGNGFVEYNTTTRAAGKFYGGTTDPISTTRLNYDGVINAMGGVFKGLTLRPKFISDQESTYTVTTEDSLVFCNDAAGNGVQITLPASPRDGQIVIVRDIALMFGTVPSTFLRNGKLINGGAANLSTSGDNSTWILMYSVDAGSWYTSVIYAV